MQPTMQHQFAQVPSVQMQRSKFNRSHGYKTTFDAGWLIPCFLDETLPGDTFNLSMTTFARLSTLLHPFMDNLWMDCFFFHVPIRLIWTNFPKMFGEQANPGDSTSYLVPTMTSPVGGYVIGSLQDYMGLPTASATAGAGVNPANVVTHSALFTRAYNLVYNEWFRDQNLQNSVTVNLGDGPDAAANYVLLRRGKRHDYFTSALPWPQKGPAVNIPLGGNAPVKGIGAVGTLSGSAIAGASFRETTPLPSPRTVPFSRTTAIPEISIEIDSSTMATAKPLIYADLSQATSATINQLRQAFQVQKIYERDARGGTRYTELIQAHFGVVSPDARLNRPEYLGGGSTAINVNPIAQTSAQGLTGGTTPLGNLGAIGTGSLSNVGFTKSFTEHGILIGLVSVRADMNYQQGLNRMFSRSTRFDFYWPALAQIGEQAILNKEIYCRGDADVNDNAVFGYQERFGEYRYKPSVITGQYRTGYTAGTLDSWHLAQAFTALPTLNSTFIVENPPVARVVAVPSQPHFLFDSSFNLMCSRPMPMYGVPGNIDRF